MEIPKQGMNPDEVLQTLESYRSDDLSWREGRSFGYVYHAGDEAEALGKRVYAAFLSENALDFSVYPSLLRIERELVDMGRRHLGGGSEVVGNFTSGGTESILLAVKSARDWARQARPQATKPEIILPVTAHAAFHKAAHYLGLRVVQVPVDPETYRANPRATEEAINEQTVMIVGSATSYAHGVVDPIEDLGRIADEHGVWLHVDGCIGGFILPYLSRLGVEVPSFDLSVRGVSSISMDLHKYAYAPKGASLVLYRDASLRAHQIYSCARWTGYSVVNTTVQSTKSGGPMAAAWAVLNHIGDEGYLDLARSVKDATDRYLEGIRQIPGLRVLGQPLMSLLAFTSDEVDVFHLADEMTERGWYVQPQLAFDSSKENIHLTVAPQNVEQVEAFLADLKDSMTAAKALSDGQSSQLVEALGQIDFDQLSPASFGELLAMAGIVDGQLPKRRAQINMLLNALPRPVCERLLSEFTNQLFVP